MNITIIHGPKASGKTRNKELLKKKFNAERVVDDWYPDIRLRSGDLALTNLDPPFHVDGAKVMHIRQALTD